MVRRTIWAYMALSLMTNFAISFIAGTYMMFLLARGLNLFEANVVNFAFFITLFLCEIPTGAVADVFGRKASFVTSCFLYALGMFVYANSYTFWGFIAAEMLAAVGTTFASGAFDAWMVDKLRYHGYTESVQLIMARRHRIVQLATVTGAISGAALADKNIALPWAVGGCVMTLAGILSIVLMKEEYFVREAFSWKEGWKSTKTIVASSFGHSVSSKVVRFLFLTGALQYFAVMAANMQWQPLFSKAFPDKASLGIVFAGIAGCIALGSTLSPMLLKATASEERSLLIVQVATGAAMMAVVLFPFPAALLMFLLHEVPRGAFDPLSKAYLNDHIPSKERATINSIYSMARHIGGAVGLLISGAVAQYGSIPAAWILSGIVLIGGSVLLARNGDSI